MIDRETWTRMVFAWLRQIKGDHDLPASAALLALELIDRFNRKQDGIGWAGCDTLGKAIGMSQSRIVRLMHLLEDRGHIRVEWGTQGRGHSSRYWMILKPAPAQVSDDEKHAAAHVSERRRKTCIWERKTCARAQKTCASAYEPTEEPQRNP
jgi:hypothetical protein